MQTMVDLTRMLDDARSGHPGAEAQLATVLYEELRNMARREMGSERPDHTLQPTALVHEAYLRLIPDNNLTFENRAHFFGAASSAIRRVLVDHARKRARHKRGGDRARVTLDTLEPAAPIDDGELIEVDDELRRLSEFAPNPARVVELRFFAGLSVEEIARVLKVSTSSIQRDWRVARAWLRGRLASHGS